MAFRTWGKVLLAALGVGVVSGAGQLGIAYGLGLVRFNRTFDAVIANQWPAQRVWVGWFAMVAAITGALIADRLARRYDLPTTPGVQAATAAAGALGALVVAPLSMQPARTAQLASADPVVSVGVIAALGAGIGFVAALATLVQRPVRWNAGAVIAAVWFLAVLSVMPSLGPDDPLPAVRLGVLDPSWLGAGTAQRLAVVTMPALALVAGALTGALARSRGLPMPAVASCGVGGPALLALAYLVAGPGGSSDGYQAAPYWGALIAVVAGGLGSVLAAMARWPLTTGGTAETGGPASTVDTAAPDTTTTSGTVDIPAPRRSTEQFEAAGQFEATGQYAPAGQFEATGQFAPAGQFEAAGRAGATEYPEFGTRSEGTNPSAVADQPFDADRTAVADRLSDIHWPLADRYGSVEGFGSSADRTDSGTSQAEPRKSWEEPVTWPDTPVTGAAGPSGTPAGGSAPAEFPTDWSGVRRPRTEDFWPTQSLAEVASPAEAAPHAEAVPPAEAAPRAEATRAAAAPAEVAPPAVAPPPVIPGRAVPPPVIPGPETPAPVTPGPAAPPPVARPAATPSPITSPPTAPAPVTARGAAPTPVSGRSTAPPPVGGPDAGPPPVRDERVRDERVREERVREERVREERVTDESSDRASIGSPVAAVRPPDDEQSPPSLPTGTDESWDAFAPTSRLRPDRDATPTWSFHQSIELGGDQAPTGPHRGSAGRADAEQSGGAPTSPTHAEPSRTEPGQYGRATPTGLGRTETTPAETARTGTGRSETYRIDPGQADSGQTGSGQTDSGQTNSGPADSGQPHFGGGDGFRADATRTDLEAAEGNRPEADSEQETAPAGSGDPVTSTGRIRRGLFRRNRSGSQSAPEQSRKTDSDTDTGPTESKQRESKQRESKGRNRTDEPVPARDEEYVEWVSGLSEPDPAADDLSRESGGRRSLRSTGRHHAD
ncbi:hypothetical protein I0C86_21370 [Plantactinospora sp. S1510]|uniref:Uncharacterized protein n=1 Tax=Plantactinospora alkalitolerans TaxID=2789879 RepID=A0ABS0GZK0_9ACTN|nr:hypothetical protein [Plantactinospora alkalitolerans]MBF9131491.1 hypothetical protein [Plantactinospora alkalitolerans]